MRRITLVVFAMLAAASAAAQHQHHAPPPPTPTPSSSPVPAQHEHHPPPATATPSQPPAAPQHEHHAAPSSMPSQPPADTNLFQSDMALMTGMTAREPMGAPDPRWRLMALGVARLGYNRQGGPSGEEAFESSNWSMLHLTRGIGRGRLSLMLMNSLEPWTFEKRGSPELFQTGETFRGRPLVDRQHPHDFFMNLSATWRAPLSNDAAYWLQIAPVGEPAVGPTAFMHRASAGENPTAPLGHHWQDSSHITFNVVTGGVGWRNVALEASAFHGAEPDEDRWDVEGGSIDSAAGRVRLAFANGWSAQASHAYLHEPEALEEGSAHRTTASVQYGAEGDRPFAAMLLWGRNDEEHGTSDSWLIEAAWQLTRVDHVYGRAERVEKDRHLLLSKGESDEHDESAGDAVHVGALTFGYLRDLVVAPILRLGVGADVTAYRVPSGLEATYGDSPLSWHAFVRLRLGRAHAAHSGHAGH